MKTTGIFSSFVFWVLIATLSMFMGCAVHSPQKISASKVHQWAPKEMAMASFDEYVIQTGDILDIDVPRMVPKSPYTMKPFDAVSITMTDLENVTPVSNVYRIQPGGILQLGYPHGSIPVADKTVEEVEDMIREQLQKTLTEEYKSEIHVSVSLEQIQGLQPIFGEHLVAMDGRIQLGSYGSVYVNGLTLHEAQEAIEFHLVHYLDQPAVSVIVASYNTKNYYLFLQGAGYGDKLLKFPVTGNETVLDAFAEIQGLDRVSNAKRIRIERPLGPHQHQTLYVDWNAITAGACPETNYQIFPGDRLYVEEDKIIAFDSGLSKVIAPLERIMGFALLGAQTATRYSGSVLKGGGDPTGGR